MYRSASSPKIRSLIIHRRGTADPKDLYMSNHKYVMHGERKGSKLQDEAMISILC